MTSLGDRLNDPVCLEKSFGNLGTVSPVFNKEKSQERIGGHIVSEYKDDEFEGISIANFGYMEEISDVSWPYIYWGKRKSFNGLSVTILELRGFMFKEGQ